FAALKEDFIDITDGRSAALPDELHDFELLRGKRVVFGTHSKYLVLINSYVKGKSKPPRGSPGGMTGGTGRVDCFGVRLAIFLSKSCACLLVKKQPCNRKGGRLPFAARGNSW